MIGYIGLFIIEPATLALIALTFPPVSLPLGTMPSAAAPH